MGLEFKNSLNCFGLPITSLTIKSTKALDGLKTCFLNFSLLTSTLSNCSVTKPLTLSLNSTDNGFPFIFILSTSLTSVSISTTGPLDVSSIASSSFCLSSEILVSTLLEPISCS